MIKNNKAITLVALVITIIILLILAGIAISQLTSSGLFQNVQTAKSEHENAQEREDDILKQYENAISTGEVVSDRDTVTISKEDYDTIMEKINGLTVQNTQLSSVASGATLTSNVIRKCGNIVYINIRGNYNKEFKSADLVLGSIPEGYRPKETIVSTCNVSGFEYGSEDSSYLYIGPNGNIQIKNNKSTDYRYFHICESYIIE